jgi:hypothetical protein
MGVREASAGAAAEYVRALSPGESGRSPGECGRSPGGAAAEYVRARAETAALATELRHAEARERDAVLKAGAARADAEAERLSFQRGAEQERLLFKRALAELQVAVGTALQIPM